MELTRKRSIFGAVLALALMCTLALGSFAANTGVAMADDADDNTIYLKAAASMRYSLGDGRTSGEFDSNGVEKYEEGTILRQFEDANPNLYVDARYESSGNLLTEMRVENKDLTAAEAGRPGTQKRTDVFISAAPAQLQSAIEYGYIDSSYINLLQNKVVLVTHDQSGLNAGDPDTTFATVQNRINNENRISLGNSSVPAGNYAREIFGSLGTLSYIEDFTELYENVTEVLESINDQEATFGVVYKTDAATALASNGLGNIVILDDTQHGVEVLYPMGITSNTNGTNASALYSYLQGSVAQAGYAEAGFDFVGTAA